MPFISSNKKIVIKTFGLIFIIFILILLLFDKIIMPFYIHHNKEVILPDIIGKSISESQTLLKSKDLKLIIEDKKPDVTVPPNVVLIQNPSPNSVVRKGRRVYVILSTNENPEFVPSIIGNSEREATIKLNNIGLKIGFIERDFSSYFPEGVVINQSPLSGARLKKGELVNITVSLGKIPDEVIVPDVENKNLEIAKKDIEKSGLKIRNIHKLVKNDLLPNTILGIVFENDVISSGTLLKPGDSVDIYISKIDTTLLNDN